MEPLISVVIPIYNMELYLNRCLDSVLNNTYRNLEVICVDDGSKDRSLEILRSYEAADPRIVVIAKENGGVSSARNAGLDRMRGDFVTFIDPDDFVHPQYFALLLEAVQKTGAEVSCCGYRAVEDKDLPVKTEPMELDHDTMQIMTAEQCFKNHTLRSFCWGRLFHADMLSAVRFREDMKYSEDSAFIAEAWENHNTAKTAVFSNAAYYYFQRETSLAKEAKMTDRFKAAAFFAEKALRVPDRDEIYLDQAIKRCLSTRYYAAHILPDREIVRECTALLKGCRQRLKKTEIYGRKEKTRYCVFIRFPGLYWLYRSITEPDMWAWERVERKKRRTARKQQSKA